MKFYKIERNEYKKYNKQFRNTFVGGRLYLIFDAFKSCIIINLIYSFIYEVVLEKDSLNSIIILWMAIVCALISYALYYKNLKEFIQLKLKEEK